MKRVTLKSLHLVNFKGAKDRLIAFNPNTTSICGDNRTGKSTTFDALTWLLFGKDARDRTQFAIKRIEDGQTLKKVDASVEGVFDVDGQEITLKRVFVEKWTKPRGETEQRFDGNTTDYFYNNVPIQAKEYSDRVAQIINEELFKTITSTAYFFSLHWEKQRDILFNIVGVMSNEDVAMMRDEYSGLLNKLGGRSFEDFFAECIASKKKKKKELDTIQPRIDQTRKLMPEPQNWSALKDEINLKESQVERVDKTISDTNALYQDLSQAEENIIKEIHSLKLDRQNAIFEEKAKIAEETAKANQQREYRLKALNKKAEEKEELESKISSLRTSVDAAQISRKRWEEKANALRKDWTHTNNSEFPLQCDKIKCPLYGIICDSETANSRNSTKYEEDKAKFYEEKKDSLSKIVEEGKGINIKVKEIENEISTYLLKENEYKDSIKSIDKDIATLQEELKDFPEIKAEEVDESRIEAVVQIDAKIKELEESRNGELKAPDNSELKEERKKLLEEISTLKLKLNDKDLIDRYVREINTLEEKARELSNEIAKIERDEKAVADFKRERFSDAEAKINRLFKSQLSFKLLDKTIKGDEFECCIPLVDGVPYSDANTAGQVNAAIDIINALTKHYGVSAPIFIDNRESVNDLIETESQIVNLIVTRDKELVIK